MTKMLVELEWDGDDLGPMWMNGDNLRLLLFSETFTREELLKVKVYDAERDLPEWERLLGYRSEAEIERLKGDLDALMKVLKKQQKEIERLQLMWKNIEHDDSVPLC